MPTRSFSQRAKSRTHGRELRSTGTKATTRVACLEHPSRVEKQLEAARANSKRSSRRRWSSRRRPPRCSRSSQARPASWGLCSRPCWRTRRASARPVSAFCSCPKAMAFVPSPLYGAACGLHRGIGARAFVMPARTSPESVPAKAVVHIADMQPEASLSRRRPLRWRGRLAGVRTLLSTDAQGRRVDRGHRHLSSGGSAVHRQADRAGDRILRPRPSSPSRTRDCSTSCASAR